MAAIPGSRTALRTLAFLMVFPLTGCGGTGGTQAPASPTAATPSEAPSASAPPEEIGEHKLVFAHITADTFPYQDGGEKFKELIEASSDGKMTVEVFCCGQLGAEIEIEEQILEGSVHFGVGAGGLATFAPIMNIFELLLLIKDQEHMQRIIDSPVVDDVASRLEEADFKVVGWFSTGNMVLQTKTPIVEPSDLAGIKMRVIQNPALVDGFTALGAAPVPLPFPEVYTSIQQGVVDAAHFDWGSVAASKIYELIDYSTGPETNFLAEPRPVIMSLAFWDSLNGTEQALIVDAMEEAAAYEREVAIKNLEESIIAVKDFGVEFTVINEAAFLEKIAPVWDKWAKQLDAEDLLEQIKDLRP